jgi:hypothetical protein
MPSYAGLPKEKKDALVNFLAYLRSNADANVGAGTNAEQGG